MCIFSTAFGPVSPPLQAVFPLTVLPQLSSLSFQCSFSFHHHAFLAASSPRGVTAVFQHYSLLKITASSTCISALCCGSKTFPPPTSSLLPLSQSIPISAGSSSPPFSVPQLCSDCLDFVTSPASSSLCSRHSNLSALFSSQNHRLQHLHLRVVLRLQNISSSNFFFAPTESIHCIVGAASTFHTHPVA
jgi:hypothetical protein